MYHIVKQRNLRGHPSKVHQVKVHNPSFSHNSRSKKCCFVSQQNHNNLSNADLGLPDIFLQGRIQPGRLIPCNWKERETSSCRSSFPREFDFVHDIVLPRRAPKRKRPASFPSDTR